MAGFNLFARNQFSDWAAKTWTSISKAQTPTDEPRAHASGPDPDRILLFGSDMFVGRGVLSHDVAFAGHLARKIAAATSRGVDVHIEARSSLTIADAVADARLLDLPRYDAVVVELGLTDALAETSPADWEAHLEVLLQVLLSEISVSAQLFLIANPDPTIVPLFRSRHGEQVARTFTEYNDRSRAIAATHDHVTFVEFPVKRETTGDRLHTSRTFEQFADTIAPAMVEHLEQEFLDGAPRSPAIADEAKRQASLDGLGILDTEPEERFDRIVAQAQREFGTEWAAFNLIDNDRRWSKSFVGPSSSEGVREKEFCNTSIHTQAGLFVDDATEDPRFRDFEGVVTDPHVRFYAGYPVEAPDGQRIGTLCVYDRKPRETSIEEESRLRDLALKIEREIWAMPAIKERMLKV